MIAAPIPTNSAGPNPVMYLMLSMTPWDWVAAPAT
jgi:hypothetical protein